MMIFKDLYLNSIIQVSFIGAQVDIHLIFLIVIYHNGK
jgi:hypothetical protein